MFNLLVLADTLNGGGAEIQLKEEMLILCNIASIYFISAVALESSIIPNQITYLGSLEKNDKSELLKKIANIKPEITHLHNTWNTRWYGFIHLIQSRKIMTLHDYRIVCPSGWRVRPTESGPCPKRSFLTCIKAGCLNPEWSQETGSSYFWWVFSSYLRSNIATLITVNKGLIEILKNENHSNIHHINLPMASPPELSYHKRERSVIFAGQLGAHKGIHRLIRTIKSVSKIDITIKFILIGDGRFRNHLKNELNCGNASILGSLERSALIDLLGKVSLAYLPSRWQENFNLISREARLVGTPILVPNLGGFVNRLNAGLSEYFEPNLSDDDSNQLIRMINSEAIQYGSLLDRKDELWTCSVSNYMSQIEKIYFNF